MSITTAQERVARLVRSGFRGQCRPAERLRKVRSTAQEIDELEVMRLEAVFSALADRTRLKILKLLGKEELCSCEVMAGLDLTQPTTSHHLGILERTGLVVSRREGKWVFYRLADPKLGTLLGRSLVTARRD